MSDSDTATQSGPNRNSDLPTRFAAGVVMIAVAAGATYASGWIFRILAVLAGALMLLEWGDMHRVRRPSTWIAVLLLIIPLLALFEYYFPAALNNFYDGSYELLEEGFPGFALVAGLAVVAWLVSLRVAMGWGFVYIGAPTFALVFLNWVWFQLTFWILLVTWATDIFAYFAGRAVGGPKLAPRVSPNKTWSGLVGGAVGAGVVGWIAGYYLQLDAVFLYIGAPMGLIAQLGDLYESSVKRRLGIKDSGRILPGHGGLLDRLDGLLPVVIATFIVLVLLSLGYL